MLPVDGVERPAELVYGERMSAALARLYPEASEALKLAIRAQHIRRWTVPRSSYPMDRLGYLRWRKDLQRKHAEWTGAIMAECGYSAEEIKPRRQPHPQREPETRRRGPGPRGRGRHRLSRALRRSISPPSTSLTR